MGDLLFLEKGGNIITRLTVDDLLKLWLWLLLLLHGLEGGGVLVLALASRGGGAELDLHGLLRLFPAYHLWRPVAAGRALHQTCSCTCCSRGRRRRCDLVLLCGRC